MTNVAPGDWLSQTALKLRVSAALAGAALAVALWHVRGGTTARLAGPVLAVLALADLVAYHRYLSLVPRAALTQRPEILRALQASPDRRLYVYDYEAPGASYRDPRGPYQLARLPQGWTEEQAGMLGMQMALAYAAAGRWKLRTGYTGDYRGLHPRPLAALIELLKQSEGTALHAKLLRMGAVSHVVTLHARGFEAYRPVATFAGPFREPIRLFAVPDPLPRAYLIGSVRRLTDEAAFSRLRDPEWDPRRELILPEGAPGSASAFAARAARVLEERPDRVVLEAELDAPGYLVLVDTDDPGWRARVDGHTTPAWRANLAFRAVPLTAGRHVVEFSYRPAGLAGGLVLSTAGGLGVLALALRRRAAALGTAVAAR